MSARDLLHAAFHDSRTKAYRVVESVVWGLILLSIATLVAEPFFQDGSRGDVILGKLDRALLWMFAIEVTTRILTFRPPELEVFNKPPLERLRREYRALGFLTGTHPITLVDKGCVKTVKGCELDSHVGRVVQFFGWLLTGKVVSTKTGEVMEFLTFEDETAIIETTFFPEVYRRYAHILASHRPYLISGLVEEDFGALTLTVEQVRELKN